MDNGPVLSRVEDCQDNLSTDKGKLDSVKRLILLKDMFNKIIDS